ncbi:MAG: Glu-tRNA(Gln) amidotransferase subunit GatE [Candidatus Nanoarchaeia archaeon]|nr:Glu-tRNA(Gln) amidotransferase subunit GatE [Candidatus Nanoarchaeia archaeon]
MDKKFDYDSLIKKIDTLGLMCGLEIHQQLEGRKLFCMCPTTIRSDTPKEIYRRKLNLSMGELNSMDKAAKNEIIKDKVNVYYGYDSTCLVEKDDEPPHSPSMQAIKSSLIVADFLKAKVVDELHFMRKIVLNGSNTSGFQRTGLVATDGFLNVDGKDYGIESICIEEDACKIEEKNENENIYNTSRLGIPLIEIATAPDVISPNEVIPLATKIGMVLRSLDNVKRGLGTIRQDLNVSIKGGVRVEIKGAQTLDVLKKSVELEALRQYRLQELRNYFKTEKIEKPELKIENVTHMFHETKSKILLQSLNKNGVIYATKVKDFLGVFGIELNPDRRVGSEFADRVKNATSLKGLFHSDELPNYGVTQQEVDLLKEKLNVSQKDGFLVICGEKEKVEFAFVTIKDYMEELFLQEKGHVRQPKEDGTSAFLRVMPGSSRMYPETDIKPIETKEIKYEKPVLLEEIEEQLIKLNLHKDLSHKVVYSGYGPILLNFTKKFKNLKINFIAENMMNLSKAVTDEYKVEFDYTDKDQEDLFDLIDKNKVSKGNLVKLASMKSEGKSFLELAKENNLLLLSKEELELEIKNEIKNIDLINPKRAMGILMGKFANKGDPLVVKEIIDSYLN